jgi:hypothetical protein
MGRAVCLLLLLLMSMVMAGMMRIWLMSVVALVTVGRRGMLGRGELLLVVSSSGSTSGAGSRGWGTMFL